MGGAAAGADMAHLWCLPAPQSPHRVAARAYTGRVLICGQRPAESLGASHARLVVSEHSRHTAKSGGGCERGAGARGSADELANASAEAAAEPQNSQVAPEAPTHRRPTAERATATRAKHDDIFELS